MMKKDLVICTIILVGLLGGVCRAELIEYTFDNASNYMMASSTVSGATASDISWHPMYTGVAGDSEVAYRTDATGNNLFLINSRASDNEAVLSATGSTHFAFTITPAFGMSLNFNSASGHVDVAGYTDAGTASYIVYYSDVCRAEL